MRSMKLATAFAAVAIVAAACSSSATPAPSAEATTAPSTEATVAPSDRGDRRPGHGGPVGLRRRVHHRPGQGPVLDEGGRHQPCLRQEPDRRLHRRSPERDVRRRQQGRRDAPPGLPDLQPRGQRSGPPLDRRRPRRPVHRGRPHRAGRRRDRHLRLPPELGRRGPGRRQDLGRADLVRQPAHALLEQGPRRRHGSGRHRRPRREGEGAHQRQQVRPRLQPDRVLLAHPLPLR